MRERGLNAFLVTDTTHIRYLSGFTGSSALAVVTPEGASFFLTDSRYEAQSGEEVEKRFFKVRVFRKTAHEALSELIKRISPGVVGFESEVLSYDSFVKLRKDLKRVNLKSAPGVIGRIMQNKDAFEVERIRSAAGVLDMGFGHARRILAQGVVEKEAAFSIEKLFRKNGAEGLAFDIIIASGYRAALPHGKASDKKIRRGELVVVDMGARLDGYNSDESRSYCIGKANRLQNKIYGIVRDAQARAIDKIRDGIPASRVDMAARGYIGRAGYGKYFGHSTGHGVGLNIHEGPMIGPASKDVLTEGMVVTVEPGIYLPGWGGVRIEDMALVRKDGCELITKTPRELACL